MTVLSTDFRYVDIGFQGVESVIATAVLELRDGVALVDPGPGSCLPTLRARLAALGLDVSDVTAILLTHIHLDHAGATGTIAREHPALTVYVHERGAPHMADPSRLLDSASRLYGDMMGVLWGAIEPVPAASLRTLAGGERIDLAGRVFDVAYTPGHATHHVSYFEPASGIAFVGDTAGVRIGDAPFVVPPTPPPDIDLRAWRESLARILAWSPQQLFLTHFGPTGTPAAHVQEVLERLEYAANVARAALVAGGTDAEQAARFRDGMRTELRRHMSDAQLASYELAVPLDHCYLGLARYWRKQGVGTH